MTQNAKAAIGPGLIRGKKQLPAKERRRGMHPRLLPVGKDLLHSLAVWRLARGNGTSADAQYLLHRLAVRNAGCGAYAKGFSYHVAREAELRADRSVIALARAA